MGLNLSYIVLNRLTWDWVILDWNQLHDLKLAYFFWDETNLYGTVNELNGARNDLYRAKYYLFGTEYHFYGNEMELNETITEFYWTELTYMGLNLTHLVLKLTNHSTKMDLRDLILKLSICFLRFCAFLHHVASCGVMWRHVASCSVM